MGYWNAGRDGTSLRDEPTGLIWGDSPADAFDDAILAIAEAFERDVGRLPTAEELRAGLEFSLRGMVRRKKVGP